MEFPVLMASILAIFLYVNKDEDKTKCVFTQNHTRNNFLFFFIEVVLVDFCQLPCHAK